MFTYNMNVTTITEKYINDHSCSKNVSFGQTSELNFLNKKRYIFRAFNVCSEINSRLLINPCDMRAFLRSNSFTYYFLGIVSTNLMTDFVFCAVPFPVRLILNTKIFYF
jgi:hypothetical protein